MRVLWDAHRPTSEKATFKCADCQHHQALGEEVRWCALKEQLALPYVRGCQDLRLRITTEKAA
jgi:hypothetical protein